MLACVVWCLTNPHHLLPNHLKFIPIICGVTRYLPNENAIVFTGIMSICVDPPPFSTLCYNAWFTTRTINLMSPLCLVWLQDCWYRPGHISMGIVWLLKCPKAFKGEYLISSSLYQFAWEIVAKVTTYLDAINECSKFNCVPTNWMTQPLPQAVERDDKRGMVSMW